MKTTTTNNKTSAPGASNITNLHRFAAGLLVAAIVCIGVIGVALARPGLIPPVVVDMAGLMSIMYGVASLVLSLVSMLRVR